MCLSRCFETKDPLRGCFETKGQPHHLDCFETKANTITWTVLKPRTQCLRRCVLKLGKLQFIRLHVETPSGGLSEHAIPGCKLHQVPLTRSGVVWD